MNSHKMNAPNRVSLRHWLASMRAPKGKGRLRPLFRALRIPAFLRPHTSSAKEVQAALWVRPQKKRPLLPVLPFRVADKAAFRKKPTPFSTAKPMGAFFGVSALAFKGTSKAHALKRPLRRLWGAVPEGVARLSVHRDWALVSASPHRLQTPNPSLSAISPPLQRHAPSFARNETRVEPKPKAWTAQFPAFFLRPSQAPLAWDKVLGASFVRPPKSPHAPLPFAEAQPPPSQTAMHAQSASLTQAMHPQLIHEAEAEAEAVQLVPERLYEGLLQRLLHILNEVAPVRSTA